MATNKTSIALAVTVGLALSGTAPAQDRYGLSKLRPFNQKHATLAPALQQQASTWLVKASASGAAKNSRDGTTRGLNASYQARLRSVNSNLDNLELDLAALDLDLTVTGRVTHLAAGLVVSASEAAIQQLRGLDSVYAILPVYDYTLDIADSADYIGAASVVTAGTATGQGVAIAVLDSGLDYTHAAVGGMGTQEAYDAAVADLADTPAWPIGRVLGGYDFFNGDPDPMDNNDHGTSVTHSVLGAAPNAGIYIYTVCDFSCPGAAILNGLEAAMDPNGDGDIADRVDVINISLGSDFGSRRGGATQDLINAAVELGVVTVVSAGNDGAKPFIVGDPSTTTNAISVGAMKHPTILESVAEFTLNGETTTAIPAAFNPDEVFTFDSSTPLQYSATNPLGCEPFTDDDFTGSIALIDRGACYFVDKVANAQAAGAELVIVANNIPGDSAFTMGGTPTEPLNINAVMVSLEDGEVMKAGLVGDGVTFAFSSELYNLVGAIASFTSRGPVVDGYLKPEITAPGTAIDTALAGTGNETRPISGTSFSSPITAGAFGLLKEAMPERTALELKATMMNTANLNVTLEGRAVNPDSELAPISYIGAGLVDVAKATGLPVAAWATDTKQAALGFGYLAATELQTITKQVTVKNFSAEEQTYTLSLAPRYQNDVDTAAVSMAYPQSITVPAGQTITFEVTATLDPSAVHTWGLTDELLESDEGSEMLTTLEYDGALNFSQDGGETTAFHLVYHMLPQAKADLEVSSVITDAGVNRVLTNTGAAVASPTFLPITASTEVAADAYADLLAAAVELVSVEDTLCTEEAALVTTFVTRDAILTPNIGGFFADFDLDGDGVFDYTAQSIPHSAFGSAYPTGRTVTFNRLADDLSGFLYQTLHTPGDHELSLVTCLEDFELTQATLADMTPTIAFRMENSWNYYFPTESSYKPGMVVSTAINFFDANALPLLLDDNSQAVDSLAPGESAILSNVGNGNFIMTSGIAPRIVSMSTGSAPTMADQAFDTDENTATGTVIGQLHAEDAEPLLSPISEFFVTSSSSIALRVSKAGEVVVADGSLLDHDAGLTEVVMQVVAIDSAGATSDPASVTVTINNLPDETSEQPAPPPPAPAQTSSSGGGVMGGIAAGYMLLLAVCRRRRTK